MASYHLSASVIGRSDGRSAVAASAYRAGTVLTDPDTGTVHDYRRKGGVVSAFVLTPEGAPDWAQDRAALWSAVHARETRKNSQLAREVRLALPLELDADARAELVREWVQRECVERGMVADVAIHDPTPGPDRDRNPHAHVMLTMRPLDSGQMDGWSKNRARDWNDKATLEGWRASWADAQNVALEQAGATARVDHRSLADQRAAAIDVGDNLLAEVLDRPPEPRLGVAAGGIDARAKATVSDRGIALADARATRSALLDALDRARDAARSVAEAVLHATRPVSELTALLFARPPRSPAAAPSMPEPPKGTTLDDDDPTPA